MTRIRSISVALLAKALVALATLGAAGPAGATGNKDGQRVQVAV